MIGVAIHIEFMPVNLKTPFLFDLIEGPAEKNHIADAHPGVLIEIKEMVERYRQILVEVKDQLAERESN